jgi:hypothetical protein
MQQFNEDAQNMPVYINYHNQTVKNYIYSNGDLDL